MKLISTALIYLLLISNTKAQWFWQNSSNQNSVLFGIDFIDSNNGWIVGQLDSIGLKGLLYKTTNGGINWERQVHSDFWTISEVIFVDSLIGYAVGQNNSDSALSNGNFVFKSTNGGRSWFRQFIPIDRTLWAVDFVDYNTGWAVGSGLIIKTIDGGSNWEVQYEDSVFFNSVDFIDSLIGWATGWGDKIIKTTDGGINWFYQMIEPGWKLNSVKFINENVGWTVGDSGRIFKTTDGGNNWLIKRRGITDDLFSISIIDENNVWTAGFDDQVPYHSLHKTTNSGSTWERQFLPDNISITVVQFLNQNTGWVAGNHEAILKTTTGGVIPVELISFNASVKNNVVYLNWLTATETNNQGFEVEKSERSNVSEWIPSGKSQTWNKIGFVEGYGTTTEIKSYSFIDENVIPGTYSYRLKQIDFDGSFEYSDVVEITIGIPDKFSLHQNYPNPFNPKTKIKYEIPGQARNDNIVVTLKIYNILGKEIATLVKEEKPAGVYEIEFDGSSLSSGVYFYSLRAGDFNQTKKLLLLK